MILMMYYFLSFFIDKMWKLVEASILLLLTSSCQGEITENCNESVQHLKREVHRLKSDVKHRKRVIHLLAPKEIGIGDLKVLLKMMSNRTLWI